MCIKNSLSRLNTAGFVFLTSIMFCLLINSEVVQAQEVSLKVFKSKLTAQNAKPARNFLDLKERKMLDLIAASYRPEDIDMFVLFGRNTRVNIMLPSSKNIASFGEHFKINIQDGWDTHNKGVLINLGKDLNIQKQFDVVKTLSQLETWYAEAEIEIGNKTGYQLRKNGPIDNLIRVEKGDIILFKAIDRSFYAVGMVQRLEESHEGQLVIEWKLPKSF
ncbi:hypothetical protein [Sphingobacterium paucimobilis]|uniref:Uncharacterized protein n=1 Tax=Sphingobacterium paucimobilis HER1398 TaxID=1346330 RepID=U2HA82_9SPHI|nr:hypothetical protein [Sphingobacterium paucimobilis]ERJ58641.1 hypothetical protein M472_07670 [Sphingobacterium paucimobilis HER1398]